VPRVVVHTQLVRTTLLVGVAALAAATSTSAARAQVVTAELRGNVSDPNGEPLDGVQIIATDTRTNSTFGTLTNENGRFLILHLQPGGPYTVAAQRIGYRPETRDGVVLTLSRATRVDLRLQMAVVEVAPLAVEVEGTGAVFSATHTSPATQISRDDIETFPTVSRNLVELTLLSPYVNTYQNAPSIAGKGNLANSIVVDGAVNNDVFGISDTVVPGGLVNAKPISLEAVEEMQVLVAPFDVRQSNFTGGLVNVVTRSGTNDWEGSLFGYHIDENLVSDLAGERARQFKDTQFGFSFGGPIARDKAFVFAVGEFQLRDDPVDGFELGSCNELCQSIGADPAEAAEVANILRNQFGVDPGTPSPATLQNPRTNIFARLDFNIGERHRLVIRDNFVHGTRARTLFRSGSGYMFSSSFNTFTTDFTSIVAQLFSRLGSGWNNEFLLNFETIRGGSDPAVDYSLLSVASSGPDYVLGAELSSQAARSSQDIFQLTDNLTRDLGDHRLILGTSNDLYSFNDLFQPGLLGRYNFDSIQDLEANSPSRYIKRVPVEGVTEDELPMDFDAVQIGIYAQDEWTVSDRITITYGLRVDIPILSGSPRFNPELMEAFGINNAAVPSGKPLWQPRLGFNWSSRETHRTQLRGGAGLFAGRPAYVWINNAYTNSGLESRDLVCFGANAPEFDPDQPPTTCADGTGGLEAQQRIDVVDPDFRFPLDLKISGGVDQGLPWGLTATFEVLYTKAIEEAFFEEVNLRGIQGVDRNAGNRPVYGTPTASGCGSRGGCFTNTRADDRFAQVINLTNRSGSESLLLTFQLQRRFADWLGFNGAYTYSDVEDLQVQASPVASNNIGRSTIRGDTNDPDLTRSSYARPHKIILAATGRWDLGRGLLLEVTPQYFGQSGDAYTYVVRGDPNGDGYRDPVIGANNDALYIPANSSDLAWRRPEDQQLFDHLIAANECLQEQRGRLMERNSCRYAWNNRLDMRLTLGIPTGSMGRLQLVADVINLFGSDWREGRVDSGVEALRVVGRLNGEDDGPFVYQYRGPQADEDGRIDPSFPRDPESRARWQLGLRYTF
jgi:hypothetical protein